MALPPYTIIEKSRIRYPRLKLSARDGIVVIVPVGFDQTRVPAILIAKGDWLRKHADRLREQKKYLEPEPPGHLPERLILRAIGEEWSVDYRRTDMERVVGVERDNCRLLLYGDIDSTAATEAAIKRWLGRKAHEHLVPWLERLSRERSLPICGVTVKSQRTRWASCSKTKRISLNQRLLFLPGHLVGYVLLHELVHTKEMNHGKRYWTLLRSYCDDVEARDAALRNAWRFVPSWLARGGAAGKMR